MLLCLTFIWATAGFSAPPSEEDDVLKDLEAELQRSLKVEKATKSSPAVEGYLALSLKYLDRGESDKAIKYANKGLELGLVELGAEHHDVGLSYNNLGFAYNAKGEYDKAIGYYEKDLAISIKALGAEHPHVGGTYNNLGGVYNDKGDKAIALAYLLKAKAIYLKKLGAQHPKTKKVQLGIDSLK